MAIRGGGNADGTTLRMTLSGLLGQQHVGQHFVGQQWIQAVDTELAQQRHSRRLQRRNARRRGQAAAAQIARRLAPGQAATPRLPTSPETRLPSEGARGGAVRLPGVAALERSGEILLTIR